MAALRTGLSVKINGLVSGSGSQVGKILGDLRYSLPTSLSQCIYMSRGLANELLVT